MDIVPFFSALLIGFLLVIPVGPVALLVIQRSIKVSEWSGVRTGIGSLLADFIYALIAGFGVVVVADFIQRNEIIFGIIGASILLLFGIKIFREKPHLPGQIYITNKPIIDSLTAFLITISNPASILLYSSIFIYLKPLQTMSLGVFVGECVLGFFLGGLLWWYLLSRFMSHLKHKIDEKKLRIFNIFSGSMMVFLGATLITKLLFFN